MPREFDRRRFRDVFQSVIGGGVYHEAPDYYPRYRTRYEALTELYAQLAPSAPASFLDIGGGIYATLAAELWGDHATAADVGDGNFEYLRSRGVTPIEWDLCNQEAPCERQFDVVMFSEVIEHLPIPGHVAIEKLARTMKPGGVMICTTPNFYRLRNIIYVLLGRRIYDNFRHDAGQALGHVIEYDAQRLRWQFDRAGVITDSLKLVYYAHQPNALPFRLLSFIGRPLFAVPRFRDYLVAVIRRPGEAG